MGEKVLVRGLRREGDGVGNAGETAIVRRPIVRLAGKELVMAVPTVSVPTIAQIAVSLHLFVVVASSLVRSMEFWGSAEIIVALLMTTELLSLLNRHWIVKSPCLPHSAEAARLLLAGTLQPCVSWWKTS